MKFKNNSKFKCAADRKPGVFGQALNNNRKMEKIILNRFFGIEFSLEELNKLEAISEHYRKSNSGRKPFMWHLHVQDINIAVFVQFLGRLKRILGTGQD